MKTHLITFYGFLAIPKIAVGLADRIHGQTVELTPYGVEFNPEPDTIALVPWSFIKSIVYMKSANVKAPVGK